jgi:hypothetical protein
MKRFEVAVLAGALMLSAAPLQAASWEKSLIKKIEGVYRPTSISAWDGSLKEGYDTLVVIQPGVIAWPARGGGWVRTNYLVADGTFTPERGADTRSGGRSFRKGERVIIYDIQADTERKNGDVVQLSLISVEAVDRQEGGNTVGTRYKGAIAYLFPKGYLEGADFSDVKKAINTVLVSEKEFKPMDAPATVRLGMTPEEVERVLGKPQKILDLGTKKIYVYPDLKITFIDTKVADVQ